MILGLDMGGTHTDAVIVKDNKIINTVKILTTSDILSSILQAIEKVTENINKDDIKRLVLSTTLTTNAIVQNKMNKAGLIIQSGPGLPHELLKINENSHFISGYIDHRGKVIEKFKTDELDKIKADFKKKEIKYAGIVSKFSTRNDIFEKEISNYFSDTLTFSSLGHKISGNLNFPRRMNTAFLNASVYEIHKKFVDSILEALKKLNIITPVYMLKADGGTICINESVNIPAQTITSGPAASIMGILSLVPDKGCIIALDIGGTTTDIAIIHKRAPLLEPEGITISGYKTLIRALYTQSIGVGGDSNVIYKNGFIIGPNREGPPYCMGGKHITPTDAVRFLGLSNFGDEKKASEAMLIIAQKSGLSPKECANQIVSSFTNKITNTVKNMISELNQRPVYTIHEIIEGKEIKPDTVAVIGGPAEVFGNFIAKELNCKLIIPEHSRVANAIGSAVSRTTTEITVHADTSEGYIKCIEEDVTDKVNKNYTLSDAQKFAKDMLLQRVLRQGADEKNIEIEITESQSFNMVRGFYTTGKNIRVKAQVKPGIIKEFAG